MTLAPTPDKHRDPSACHPEQVNYVELHPTDNGGVQIRFRPNNGRDEPFVSNAALVGPILGRLEVTALGPWMDATSDDGRPIKRAAIVS